MMKSPGYIVISALALLAAGAPRVDYSPGPAVYRVWPPGARQGTSADLTIEGIQLRETERLLFSEPGVTARVTTVDAVANSKAYTTPIVRLRVKLDVAPGVPVGIHGFRLKTPFGTSNWVPFAIGRLDEIEEVEPNDAPGQAQPIALPATVNGALRNPADVDVFRFELSRPVQLVFVIEASNLKSRVDSVLTLSDSDGRRLASNDNFSLDTPDSFLAYDFAQPGNYYIAVQDRAGRGGDQFHYRLTVGELPYVTALFPAGVRRGTVRKVQLQGYNLGGLREVELDGRNGGPDITVLPLRVMTASGPAVNLVRYEVDDYPEVSEREPNDDLERAQPITVPATIEGRIGRPNDRDLYRFPARKDDVIAVEVMARRLGSPLDSFLEILDSAGAPVRRAVVKAVAENSLEGSRNSVSMDLARFAVFKNLEYFPNDYILLNERELIRLEESQRNIDDRSVAQGYLGQRIAFLGTTSQNHPDNAKIHKVRILPPDATPPADGLPSIVLYYRNDDGGPGFGKDSYLLFTAPHDGHYIAALRDLRNGGGESFAYRLTVRRASPDFRLYYDDGFLEDNDGRACGSRNPGVPRGEHAAVTLGAQRIDGFDGKIKVELAQRPAGLRATTGTIRKEEYHCTLDLSAEPDAPEIQGSPLAVVGRARINGREVAHRARDPYESLNVITVTRPAVIGLDVQPRSLSIRPGGSCQFRIQIERRNGYARDVALALKNLPPGIFVKDRAVAGTRIDAGENNRLVTLVADPTISPVTFQMLVLARIRSEQAAKMRGYASLEESVEYSSGPIAVTVENSAGSSNDSSRSTAGASKR